MLELARVSITNAKYAKTLDLSKDIKSMENYLEARWLFKEFIAISIGLILKELPEKEERPFKGQERMPGSK
jgi:hypothetical protein